VPAQRNEDYLAKRSGVGSGGYRIICPHGGPYAFSTNLTLASPGIRCGGMPSATRVPTTRGGQSFLTAH
jgi:hypothetical protein